MLHAVYPGGYSCENSQTMFRHLVPPFIGCSRPSLCTLGHSGMNSDPGQRAVGRISGFFLKLPVQSPCRHSTPPIQESFVTDREEARCLSRNLSPNESWNFSDVPLNVTSRPW